MANKVAAAFARVKKGFRERRLQLRQTQQEQRPIPKRGQVKHRIAAKTMRAINKKVKKAKISPCPTDREVWDD
ncbi:hypothetical protein HPP92_022233 [Vanilla planifolia]|nr:hypothetical protein HPP92_022233 [Vanilla planifolia]